jgi:hypothetical protein
MDSTSSPLPRAELYRAYRVVFPAARASQQALGELTREALQAAYRRRVFEVHPDRAAALEISPSLATDRLRRVTEAHAQLLAYLQAACEGPAAETEPAPPPARSNPDEGPCDRHEEPRRLYAGALPDRRLLLGQFLYYTGHISWHELLDAIVWQRALRPRFGELSVRLGMLTAGELGELLSSASRRPLLGERAVRRGYLDGRHVRRVLLLQRRLQRPIGAYFVDRGILGSAEIRSLELRQRAHNERSARWRPGASQTP